MLFHGQASIAVCEPDTGRHKQCVNVVFSLARQLIGEVLLAMRVN